MRIRTSLRIGCVVCAVLLASGAARATANLVANGDFETGDFSGWTQFGNTDPFYTAVDTFAPQAGTYAAFFGPAVADPGGISQSLATVAGQSYTVSFWLQNEADVLGNAKGNTFQFDWNGAVAPQISMTDANAFGYRQYSLTLTATSASTDLRFTFGHDPAYWDLDTVSVVASAVPEPGTWTLLLAGLLSLGLVRRRLRD